jgi:DNA-binding response OmpR family regulator
MGDIKSVLIIDDVEGLSYYLARTFERAGVKPYEARGGEEGLRLFKEAAPDLVLLDMHLPDMNGLDVLIKIRELGPDTRVMIMSGDAGLVAQLRQTSAAIEFVDKPIDMRDLFEKLGLSRR